MEISCKQKNCFVIKTHPTQQSLTSRSPKLQNKRYFNKLNLKKDKRQSLIKLQSPKDIKSNTEIHQRRRSSESTLEGSLNKRCKYIFLTFTHQKTKFQKHQFSIKMWRKFILCVQALQFMFKIALIEHKIKIISPPQISICQIYSHSYPQSPSNTNIKKSSNLETKTSFGEKFQTLILPQKKRLNTSKQNTSIKQLKKYDIRITRLISQKTLSTHSLYTTIDTSKQQLSVIHKLEQIKRPSLISIYSKKVTLKLRNIN